MDCALGQLEDKALNRSRDVHTKILTNANTPIFDRYPYPYQYTFFNTMPAAKGAISNVRKKKTHYLLSHHQRKEKNVIGAGWKIMVSTVMNFFGSSLLSINLGLLRDMA